MTAARRALPWLCALLPILSLSCSLACSSGDQASEAKDTMTESQRDSTIAGSSLPGAAAVGKALEVADSARVRTEQSLPEDH